MKLTATIVSVVCLLAASQAMAQQKKFVGYIIKSKTEVVEGVMLVNGYSPAELLVFVGQDCASGQSGALKYVGKQYKKRGNQFQKFRTSCKGGPSPRIGNTSQVSVEVELMPDGRNMTEYTYSDSGKLAYSRYIR